MRHISCIHSRSIEYNETNLRVFNFVAENKKEKEKAIVRNIKWNRAVNSYAICYL